MLALSLRGALTATDRLARAKGLGANHGINYKTTPDWQKAALEFTGGRGVNHVVKVGGAATPAQIGYLMLAIFPRLTGRHRKNETAKSLRSRSLK
jgi:NADPH:quinone reductase-like Zn-dependent oxidoreductase